MGALSASSSRKTAQPGRIDPIEDAPLFAKVSGVREGEGLYAYPARLGYWPAAAGLFHRAARFEVEGRWALDVR